MNGHITNHDDAERRAAAGQLLACLNEILKKTHRVGGKVAPEKTVGELLKKKSKPVSASGGNARHIQASAAAGERVRENDHPTNQDSKHHSNKNGNGGGNKKMMNRFEAILAPPTLSSKDLAVAVRMQKEIPRDKANALRMEMMVPEVRLYDELTTLRFRRPGPEEENGFYRQTCATLSGASGTPIPYRFFKGEFEQLLNELGAKQTGRAIGQKRLRTAVTELTDPWRLQAYAALCARIAEASETEDPSHAGKAWDMAFSLYQKFFEKAKVEESTTYRQQTEEKFRQDTVTAWNGFLRQMLERIIERAKGYIRDKKPESSTACMDALYSKSLRAVDKDAADRIMGDLLVPYVNALSSAPTMKDAVALYNAIPAALLKQDSRHECERAMLGAMSKELDRKMELEADRDVAAIVSWVSKNKVDSLYASGTPLVKKAAADFYKECGAYYMKVLSGYQEAQRKYTYCIPYAESLISLLPYDFVLGEDKEGSKVTCNDLMGLAFGAKLKTEYRSKIVSVRSEREARSIGQTIYRLIQNTPMEGSDATGLRKQFGLVTIRQLAEILFEDEMTPKMQLVFLEAFPESMAIAKLTINDEPMYKVGDYKQMLRERAALEALATFARSSIEDEEWESSLKSIISYALQCPNTDINGSRYIDLADGCCLNAFIKLINQKDKVSDSTFRTDYQPILEKVASFLPPDCPLPIGNDNTMPLDTLISRLNFDINIDTYTRDKARKARGPKDWSKPILQPSSPQKQKPANKPKPEKKPKPQKPVKTYSSYRQKAPVGKVIKSLVLTELPFVIPWMVLFIISLVNPELPIGWRYVKLLLGLMALFRVPIALSQGFLKYGTRHEYLWKNVLVQGGMLFAPVTLVLSLVFFGAMPMPVWAIIVLSIYGVFYLIVTIVMLASKKISQ